MISDKQISKWLIEKLINKNQAEKMQADITKAKNDSKSNKLIIIFSIIGALLLGIGTILFIGSNWKMLGNFTKFLILMFLTIITFYIGHFLKYQNKNFPYVGSALTFLSALLFGATIILTAQIYNWNANNYWLVLIWMIGIIPLVYLYNSKSIAALLSTLLFIWVGLVIFRNMSFWNNFGFREILPLYFIIGTLMMNFGVYHYIKQKFSDIARIYRIMGIEVMMITIFLLTFKAFNTLSTYQYDKFSLPNTQIIIGFTSLSILAIISMFINLFFNPGKITTSKYENGVGIILTLLIIIFYFFPSTSVIYGVIFNLIFVSIILFLLYLGNKKEDMTLMNMGIYWLGLFLIVKYFDFFYSMMQTSLFMLVGGLILVLGSIVLEKKRRQIKKDFGVKNEKK